MNDDPLFTDYLAHPTPEAFRRLVDSYINLVYSTALRSVYDRHLAEDLTQNVFALLAQKAHDIKPGTILAGWLYQTTRNLGANMHRQEQRRRSRERQAALTRSEQADPEPTWSDTAAVLDAALEQLPAAEQKILILRYLRQQSTREVSAALGLTEDATRQRLSRAVRRLRDVMARQGVVLGVPVLLTMLEQNALQAAPAALTGQIIGSTTAAVAASAAATTAQGAAMTTGISLKTVLAVSAAVAVLSTGAGLWLYAQSQPPAPAAPATAPAASAPATAPQTAWQKVTLRALAVPDKVDKRYDTPLATLATFEAAMLADDIDTVMTCFHTPEDAQKKFLRSLTDVESAKTLYKRAVVTRFGEAVRRWSEPITVPERLQYWLDELSDADVSAKDDRAKVLVPPDPGNTASRGAVWAFRRTDGRWQASMTFILRMHDLKPDPETKTDEKDLERFVEMSRKLAKIWRDAARDVEEGRYATFDAAEADRVARWHKLKAEVGIRTMTYGLQPAE